MKNKKGYTNLRDLKKDVDSGLITFDEANKILHQTLFGEDDMTTENTENNDPKIKALAKYLDCDYDDAERLIDRTDYYVLTDEEADDQTKERILESVWAFRAEFLEAHSSLDAETIQIIQQAKYEDANDPLIRTIEDVDHFVSDAISADGRGHFISHYDGQENEETIDGTTYYIYRMN
jgi:hypothetical protein